MAKELLSMKTSIPSVVIGLLLLGAIPVVAAPPVAGEVPLGLSVQEAKLVAIGLSAKKQILGSSVYSDKGENVGKVEDVIVTPEGEVSVAIVSVGGFLGIGAHNVAVPVRQLKLESDKFVLSGASKEALKKLPEFRYASS
jgi:sporulation protein YlmC with PRC-barrel domain